MSSSMTADTPFERLRDRLFGRLDQDKPYRIVYYRGFGSPAAVWLKGRVLRERDPATPSDSATFWQNLLATYQRFETDEVPNAVVRIEAFGQTYATRTDDKGYFERTIQPPADVLSRPESAGRAWFPVRYVLPDILEPATDQADERKPVRKDGHLLMAPAYSQFGVISDIDDTVLITGATNLLHMAKLTFLGNAYTRLPFGGVAAFYRALQSGPVTTLFNPIYYVSSSPWNLYDLLVDFFRIQGIPKGPILLRDFGLNAGLLSSQSHHTHKLTQIRNVLAVNPQLPFVLIGDSGQQDPEIYAEVVRDNPGRIRAVYIRDVSPSDRRDEAVRELVRATDAYNVPMLLVSDTVAAAEHAATLGLIDPDTIPEIRADRRADAE